MKLTRRQAHQRRKELSRVRRRLRQERFDKIFTDAYRKFSTRIVENIFKTNSLFEKLIND